MFNFFKILIIPVMAILILPVSCTQDQICLSNQHAVQTGFYSAWAGTDRDSSLVNTSIHGVGLEADSIYRRQTVNRMFLPLSFTNDTTGFVINNNNLIDTIWFRHTNEMKYISRECGFTFNFTIDTVWFTNIFVDSVAIEHPFVNYGEDIENVKIYLY